MSRTARAKRWLRLHLTGNRQRYRNWLNRRARARGKSPLPDRVTQAAGSRVPEHSRVARRPQDARAATTG